MENVNATIFFCSKIEIKENQTSLINLYDRIVPVRDGNKYYLENFNLFLNCSIKFEERFEEREDCIQLNKEYEFFIFLKHLDSGLGITLTRFDLKIDEEDLATWYKEIYEYKRMVRIPQLYLPKGMGNYVVKLLIQKKADELDIFWNSQVEQTLVIEEQI